MTNGLMWAIWGALMVLVMGAVSRAWTREAAGWTGGELRHPRVILIVGLVTGVPFLLGGMAALVLAGPDRWVALIFFSFAALGGYLAWEYVAVRYSISDDGFTYRTLSAGRGTARWSDVKAIRWSPSAKWLRLELADGRVVRISVLMLGLDRFASAILTGATAESDPETRTVLEACARGQPPSPWG